MSSKRCPLILPIALGSLLSGTFCMSEIANANSRVHYKLVALTGEQAPDAEPGVQFAFFTTPLNHGIMRPQVDRSGQVAFQALLQGPGVTQNNNVGIWSDAGGQLGLVARSGMHAPGTPPGVVFFGVPSNYLPFPPAFGGGSAAFRGELTGENVTGVNDGGVWKEEAGALVLVARDGDPAPGLASGITLGELFEIDVDDEARVFVNARLRGTGVTTENDEALFADHTGALTLLLREGDEAPVGEPGIFFGRGEFAAPQAFMRAAANHVGQLAVQANLREGPGVDPYSNETVFIVDALTGELSLILREGDAAPGMPRGVTFGGGSVSLSVSYFSFNDSGELTFGIRLGGAIPTTYAVYAYRDGALSPIAVSGDPAPGTQLNFTVLGSPRINANGRVAFGASVETGFYPDLGVWWDETGPLTKALIPGDMLANGLRVLSLSSPFGYNAAGQLALHGYLEDPAGTAHRTLMLMEPDGTTHILATVGEQFDVRGNGQDLREILRIQEGGLSESGACAFRLDFVDGSSGHFTASLDVGLAGDMNCDGVLDNEDIDPFTLAILDPSAYQAAWPNCDISNGDMNGDGRVDNEDIDPFVAALTGP